jgi:phosphoribosylanthranilate isomerase
MKIKLCGFKNQESVNFTLKYHPDFIGFIFYPPSKRNIELEKAKELSEINFGKTKKVAVIVDASDEYISKIIKNLNPDLLQLHGNENIVRCKYIKNKFNLPIIKSIAIAEDSNSKEIQNLIAQYNQIADFLLFDTNTSQKGGSGINFDWQILKNLSLPNEYFLSGGINIDNIKKASLISNNIILDLSSGIEKKKGIKSLDKIKELMDFVKLNI